MDKSKKKKFLVKSKKKEASQDKKLRDAVIKSRTSQFISLHEDELVNKSKELILSYYYFNGNYFWFSVTSASTRENANN